MACDVAARCAATQTKTTMQPERKKASSHIASSRRWPRAGKLLQRLGLRWHYNLHGGWHDARLTPSYRGITLPSPSDYFEDHSMILMLMSVSDNVLKMSRGYCRGHTKSCVNCAIQIEGTLSDN